MVKEAARLVQACLDNRSRAWDELLERYGRLIWSVCQRGGLRPEEAEEVFQRTWVAVVEGLGRLRDPDRLGSWIATTARHQVYQLFAESARLRRRSAPLDALAEASVPAAVEEGLEQAQRAAALEDALAALDPACRQLLELLFLADPPLDYQEIARRTGLAVGSIGPKRARCLSRLAARMAELYQTRAESDP